MKRLINALAIAVLMSVMAYAQEKSDTAKLYVGFTNLSDLGPDDIQGVNGQAQVKLFKISIVQFDAAGDFAGFFPGYGGGFYTLQAGPRAGVILAKGKVVPYGGISFGTLTDFDGYYAYSYLLGGGVDFNVSKYVFVRVDLNRQFLPEVNNSFNRAGVGVGVRIP